MDDVTPTAGLSRSQRRDRTRRQLAEAAQRLIAQHGFRETTVDDIAADVGVSQRTFFRHFPTKEDALFVRAEDIGTDLARLLTARPVDEAPLRSVWLVMLEIAAALDRTGRWLLEMDDILDEADHLHVELNLKVSRMVRGVVIEWAERRLGVLDVVDPRPGVLAGVVQACVETARIRWVAHHGGPMLRDLVDESFAALTVLAGELGEPDAARPEPGDAGDATIGSGG